MDLAAPGAPRRPRPAPLAARPERAGRPLARRSGTEQARAAATAALATDLVRGLRVLKGIGAEDAAERRYRGASRDALGATLRAARAEAAYDGAAIAATGAFLVLVTLLAGRLAAEGRVSVGELIAAVGLTQFLIGPLGRVSYVGAELARARASADRVAAVLAQPPAATGTRPVPQPVRGELALAPAGRGPLRDVALAVPAGAFVGVVAGDDAAHALLGRLTGLRGDGDATLDGVPLADLDPAGLRGAVLVAPHEADLFDGTLADNLGPGRAPGVLAAALAASAADDVAAALPDGVATPLAERGSSLSGGQRQRVALARALAADPPVLVLHDPTTAVDPATEARIADGVRAMRRGRSTLVLTSSPALLAVADRVLLVADGAVLAEGPHAELAAGSAPYRAAVLG